MTHPGKDGPGSAGFDGQEDEGQERGPFAEIGTSSRGVFKAYGGSLRAARRKPASVNAVVIACNGRCQNVSTALLPSPKSNSSEYSVKAK